MLTLPSVIQRCAQSKPNTPATICGDRRHSWLQFNDRVARLAGALKASGLQPEQRVAILGLNSDRYLETMFAVSWAGGVFVPINTRLAAPEVEYWLENSDSEVLFVDGNFVEMLPYLRDSSPKLKQLVFLDDGDLPEQCQAYEALLQSAEPLPAPTLDPHTLAALYYTGGTTGRSKGVMLSHHNLLFNAMQCLTLQGYEDDEMYLHCAPMFHAADTLNTMTFTLNASTHCFIPGFDVELALKTIEAERVTRVLWVPTMVNMAVNSPLIEKFDLSSLRSVFYGASPMPEAVMLTAMEKLPGCAFMQAYGQTEAAPVLTLLLPRDHVIGGEYPNRIKSAGRPVPGLQLEILDDSDNIVPRGTVGQVCARGDNVMMGYLGMPDVTAETLANGWLHTGDGGYMDEDGYVYIVDRVKDMIISGGENIYSIEVENALYQHAGVETCAVIGIPSEKWGEQVHAVIKLKEGSAADAAELTAHCKKLIAGFKCPQSISFSEQPLPLSGAGKILKKELREPYWAGRTKHVS